MKIIGEEQVPVPVAKKGRLVAVPPPGPIVGDGTGEALPEVTGDGYLVVSEWELAESMDSTKEYADDCAEQRPPDGRHALIAALDLSLTGTAVCKPDGSTLRIEAPAAKVRGVERLALIRRHVMSAVRTCDVVAIEGYSFGSSTKGARSIGELGGVIRLALYDYHIPFVEIPPYNRALFATGKGNAGKVVVSQHASQRAQRIFASDDEADAWVMHQMMLAHYDPENPLYVPMPKANLAALDKIQWVELSGEDR